MDFIFSQSHFADHLRPVYDALPEALQGQFLNGKGPKRPEVGDFVVVAAISDLLRVHKYVRKIGAKGTELQTKGTAQVALFEHGAGYSFNADKRSSSYAGGPGRKNVSLLPSTNRWVQKQNRKYYPHIPAPIVGCPKMDALSKIPRPKNRKPVVCISFHWDARVAPETRWAFPHYQSSLKELAEQTEWDVIGHGHPRIWPRFQRTYEGLGIEPVASFEEVCRRADVYVNDASSTIFEFAALGPVVVLNAPWYRRKIQHGLRFWDYADVGPNVNEPQELFKGIEQALNGYQSERRQEAIQEVYPYLGESAARAAEVLTDWRNK